MDASFRRMDIRRETAPPSRLPVEPVEPAGEAASRRPRILVAEDNRLNQEVCAAMLKALGYRCTIASNGREAVDAIEREPYDLVLMDFQMPEMGGLEAARIIRAREAGTGRRITIVALTAHAMGGYREQCIENGMDDYLPKPFTLEEMREMLQRWVPGPE